MKINPEKLWARSLTAIAVGAAAIALAGCSLLPGGGGNGGNGGDSDGSTTGTDTDAFSIQIGDCFNDEGLDTVSTVPVVDCSEPHDNEAYASFLLEDGELPPDEELFAAADQGCLDAFEDYVGAPYDTSVYDFTYLYPTPQSWDGGDREILCLLVHTEGPSSGSAAGSGQ